MTELASAVDIGRHTDARATCKLFECLTAQGGDLVNLMESLMSAPWLTSLQTDSVQAGWDLAIKLSRMSVKATQPSDEIRSHLRAAYDHDTAQLIATSQVIATNFQTVAAANSWWR